MTTSSLINVNVDQGYYTFSLKNSTDRPIQASFIEDRITPILLNMQDFKVGVVRFKIPTATIPLFKFQEGAYQIGISNGVADTNLYKETVIYDPSLVSDDPDDVSNRFIYTYGQFIMMLNTALSTAWAQLIADPAYSYLDGYSIQAPPYFELAKEGSHIKLVLPLGQYQDGGPPIDPNKCWREVASPVDPDLGLNIVISSKLAYLLSGFNSSFSSIGWAGDPDLKYRLNISIPSKDVQVTPYVVEVMNNPLSVLPRSYYVEIFEDYSCLYLWSFLSRILLSTNMPIEQELVGSLSSEGKNLTQRVLTDFEIVTERDPYLRDYIFFQPQGEVRYSNFQGNGVLSRMDLKLYYQDDTQTIYPIKIASGSEVNVKIALKRRKAKELLQYTSSRPNNFI